MRETLKFIDLFAGIGGMRLGFERIDAECVFTSEINEYAKKTYVDNFGASHVIVGDITKEDAKNEIGQHDILLAGFPCQPFSLAGVSKKNSLGQPHGFDCKVQGNLFEEIEKILKRFEPPAFLLENVKNLRSHDKGRTYKTIMEKLRSLDYEVDDIVIDAQGYVPQHRERIFIAGFKPAVGFSFKDFAAKRPENGPRLDSVLHNCSEAAETPYTLGSPPLVSSKYTLSPHLWNYLQKYAEKHRAKGNGFGFGLVDHTGVARTLSARYHKDGAEILVKQGDGPPRRLTPRECSRLMGFDRPGREPFRIPVSDTQAYRQFGNAVAVPVVGALAQYLLPFIREAKRRRGNESTNKKFDSKVAEIKTR